MKKMLIAVIPLAVLCSACSLSFIMNHTQGEASDVVDETQESSPKVEAAANVPLYSSSSGQNITVPPTQTK